MRYPKLTVPTKKRVLIDRFRGYEHQPEVSAGAFYDMKNLSGEAAPLLRVRRRRTEVTELEGCPAESVNAVGGRGAPVVLDNAGSLWCGSHALPRLLEGVSTVSARDAEDRTVSVADEALVLRALPTAGVFRFRYHASRRQWLPLDSDLPLAEAALVPAELTDDLLVRVSNSRTLRQQGQRELVFMGGWVIVLPDGKFANTVKLRNGDSMTEGEDYGSIAQYNECSQGGTLFTPCDSEGSELELSWSDTAPAQGYWVDSSEPVPTLRLWSQSQGLWQEISPYVKCRIPGIAKGLRAGDSVELFCRFESNQGGEQAVEALWSGTKPLAAAFHDPGDANRDEGRDDYVVIPGLLPESYEIELSWHDRSYLCVTRAFPEMDFVVEAGNRLWGCRCGGGVNELYGSKLGDFRNWFAFEGLSTDSYRVARGHEGPYTGAAVLGGCPLFFRTECLEKIYPSAGGDHGVVTVSLEGIQAGSAKSAVVVRDRLYYKSETGICCYNGTLPVRISKALGDVAYHDAVAGVRGSRCYFSMKDPDGRANLFVYDTETGCWYREDDCSFLAAYGMGDRLYLLTRLGWPLELVGEAQDSDGVCWWAETGDLAPRLGTRRYVTRLRVSARLDPGAELRIYLSYDGGPWLRKGELRSGGLRGVTLPVASRRCGGLRLRLEGHGGMELHSLSWLTEAGSDL